MTKSILILGATSPIARAAAARLAERGDRLFLASSDLAECERVAQDLRIRYQATVRAGRFDALDPGSHAAFLDAAEAFLSQLDAVLSATGDMGTDPRTLDGSEMARIVAVNFTGTASMLGACAARMRDKVGGVILGVASVAGDRGRQSNFVYGAAKGGFALYLQGLRNLLHAEGVRVVTFKPGFVDTSMTYGKAGTFLVSSPGAAGKALVRALDHGSGVVYFPWFWRGIMWIIRSIPESLFKRLPL